MVLSPQTFRHPIARAIADRPARTRLAAERWSRYRVSVPLEVQTAVIAASAALAGVALTGLITWAVAVGADRRADAREDRRAAREAAARDQALAEKVADAFLEHLMAYRQGIQREETSGSVNIDEMFAEAWDERIELEMRQLVDRLVDDKTRRSLQLVLDGVFDDEARVASGASHRQHTLRLLSLGRELSMAAVRGQQPDEVAARDLRALENQVEAANDHRQLQRDSDEESRAL